MGKKKKKQRSVTKTKKLPFSKLNIVYARAEAYAFAFILILLVLFDKDVSSIAILLSLAWGGYRILQCYYIWMCKHEHVMDRKIKYKKLGLNSDNLDSELIELENQNITESENTI